MYLACDIGGTSTRIAASKNGIDLLSFEKYDTPKSLEELQNLLHTTVQKITEPIQGAIIGIAGLVDHKNTSVLSCPHIPYIKNMTVQQLAPYLSADIPLFIENDAALAGLAESVLGPGNKHTRSAYITISTGVGGTLIVDGKIQQTRYSFEPGHHILEIGGRDDPYSKLQGTFESLCSGTSFRDIYGVDASACTDQTIWNAYAEDLAVGLFNISLLWQPDVIILGGGVSFHEQYRAPLQAAFARLAEKIQTPVPAIYTASLGDKNGILGGFHHLLTSALMVSQ